ncbi:GDSL-type esterase/lipase family protein [Undibacterium sp. Di24W]|uniref:GDSL-type esterase/lipase family protein n=1 Tax=Undibacterium sp. Di24W TaxID=3413033 RepID=UPI003BF5E597
MLSTFVEAAVVSSSQSNSAATEQVQSSVIPVTQQREVYGDVTWMERHAQIIARNKTIKPEIVFLGDSITHFWSGEPASYRPTDATSWQKTTGGRVVTNLGYGFDYIENALWRVHNGELDEILPKLIVISIGTNNLGHHGDDAETCERAMRALLAAVRAKQPMAKILLLGIFPRHEAKLADSIADTNRRYAELARTSTGVYFLDLSKILAEPGKPSLPATRLFRDGLHPNAAGYTVIADQLAPVIDQLVKSVQFSTSPVSKESYDWWAQRNKSIAAIAKAKANTAQVVFIGDSITQGWEQEGKVRWADFVSKYNAVNLGISADTTENILWRLTKGDNLASNTLKPKAFVLLIGTNNAGHRTLTESPEDIRDGVNAILNSLRQASPDSKTILTAIFPRTNPADAINRKANLLLKALADGQSVIWFDIGHKLAPNGQLDSTIMPDKLHLSPKGYEIWSDALTPILDKIAK